ncbi:MAG TPA: GcrA family cell cycle regulator [Mesorhizobium sp.]|jgi:GcrA cell cycle regulator|nr:GcrA family cell cycle regulator [Mesorhizobium sp.]
MNWTEERVELLRRLWSEGLSASQIAAQLGGVTRNAVIGKVHRMKLSNRGRAATAAPATKKKAAPSAVASVAQAAQAQPAAQSMVKAAVAAAAVLRPMAIGATALQAQFDTEPQMARAFTRSVDGVVVPISRRLRLVQLNERTCKWPNGDPLNEDFNFCGNECADTGPYCRYHARIAFQPASDRRRLR